MEYDADGYGVGVGKVAFVPEDEVAGDRGAGIDDVSGTVHQCRCSFLTARFLIVDTGFAV